MNICHVIIHIIIKNAIVFFPSGIKFLKKGGILNNIFNQFGGSEWYFRDRFWWFQIGSRWYFHIPGGTGFFVVLEKAS